MRDLYQRLKAAGFDKKLVQSILPEWWGDDMAAVPFNRAHAEGVIASHLPFTVAQLRDPSVSLTLPPPAGGVCYKRNRGLEVARCLPSLYVAKRAVALVAAGVTGLPAFAGHASAATVRRQVMATSASVNLSSLVGYCWAAGVPVVPVARLPARAVKFDGVAMWGAGRPVIVLASGRDGLPWLAFDLAHELGHVMLGHVAPGSGVHVDAHLGDNGEDEEEKQADRFALELLTGRPDGLSFAPAFGMTGLKLAAAARREVAGTGIDPGVLSLFYGRSAGRWGAAQAALKELGQAGGGCQLLADALARHLSLDDLTDSTARFLEAVCHLPTAVTDDTAAPVR